MDRLLLLVFASTYLSLCAGSACPDNFMPFKTSVNCIRVVSEPLNFSASERNAAILHHQPGEKGRLVTVENNNILGIKFHASLAGSSGAIWISASSQFRKNSSNFTSCLALETDGTVRERQCSDRLPYAVVVDITVPIRQSFTAQITYIRKGAPVSLTTAAGISNSSNGQWQIPGTAKNTTSQIGRMLEIKEFMEEIHGGRYNFVVCEGNVSAITDTRLLRTAVIGNFSVEPTNHTVPKGGQIALECKSVGSRPRPTVNWYKNGNRITGNEDCVTSLSAATCVSRLGTLFVTNFSVSDEGLYSCIISNIAGNITSRVALLQLETNTSTLQDNRLEFSVEPCDQHLLMGDAFTIECAVSFFTPMPASGNLQPFLTYFYLNGNSMRMFMYPTKQARQRFPVMLYQTVNRSRNQFVKCHVLGIGISGPTVTTSKRANITVEEKAIVTDLSVTINGATDTQSMLNITLGSNVTITCSLQGDPPPVLSWIHNGVTRRDPISLSMSTLVVEDFHSRDAGVYQCQAENVYQISIQSVFLVAIDAQARPGAITDFSIRLISKSSAHVSWTPVTIQNTLTPLVQYRVVYKQANNTRYVTSNLIASSNHTINNLQSNMIYDVSVIAISIAGESEIATIKQVQTPPTVITTTLLDQLVLPSSAVTTTTHASSMLAKPTIAPLSPINEFVPLTVSICAVVAILIVLAMFIVVYISVRRCWWLRNGKGNYSPTSAERDINNYASRPHSVLVTPGEHYSAPEEAFMSTLSLDEIQDTEEEMVEDEIIAGYTNTAVVLREKNGISFSENNQTDGDIRVVSGVFDRLEPLNA